MDEETMMDKEIADTTQPSKKKNIALIIAAAAVVLIAVAVGVGIYNTPANRLHRQLDLGNKYLEEQNYEQAAIEFEKAIEIDDRCVEAYAGGIKAYLGAGDIDVARDFYGRTLAMLDSLDADAIAAYMDYVVEIYLAAADIYSDDIEKALEILQIGYAKTGDQRIQDKIAELMERFPAEMVLQLPTTEYEVFLEARGGNIIAAKNGLVGVINTNNEIVIPFEYNLWNSIDDNGNIVLIKTPEDGAWVYAVFDAQGNMINESDNETIVSNGIYIQDCYEGDGEDSSVDYHNMDGTLLASLPYNNEGTGTLSEDKVVAIHGFYDGMSITDVIDRNVGAVNNAGTVQWSGVKDWSASETNKETIEADGVMFTLTSVSAGFSPINSMNHGYFVSRRYLDIGEMALMDENYEMVADFDLYLVKGDEDAGFIPEFENRSDWKEDNGYRGFYHDGDYYYNYGSNMVWIVEGRDLLVDFSLSPNMTVETMDNSIVKAIYDEIYMSDENYWLVSSGGQWGYIDHDGKELAMFDDATDFYNHYAVVVENGTAYIINEEFDKIQELGEAERAYCMGNLFQVENGDVVYFYRLKEGK